MRFSEFYKVKDKENTDWFDPILSVDTPLFIDPFLITDHEQGIWISSSNHLKSYFGKVFQLVAEGSPKAKRSLVFPEVAELCLGYTTKGTGGSGSGPQLADLLFEGIRRTIVAGMDDPANFEKIAILQEGIAEDRISDMTACVLRQTFIKYTQDVCVSQQIPLQSYPVEQLRYIPDEGRWSSGYAHLPSNPASGNAIILTPKRFLRRKPNLNYEDFGQFLMSHGPSEIRVALSEYIGKSLPKKIIVDLAFKNANLVEEYVKFRKERTKPGYDFDRDPQGFIDTFDGAREDFFSSPVYLDSYQKTDIIQVVNSIVSTFKNYVEERGGWRLLWNDGGKQRSEEACQLLFLSHALAFCEANNVDVTREAEVGRGPVDFKFSSGWSRRVLLEIKKANNTRFWAGLERQLPQYMKSEQISCGYFMPVIFTDNDSNRIDYLEDRSRTISAHLNAKIRSCPIDARKGNKISASKLKQGNLFESS